MIVRELLTSFGLDLDERSFKRGNGAVDGLIRAAKGLAGIFAAYQIGSFIKDTVVSTVEAGSSVKDMADKTGLGVEALQELRYAAKLSGVEVQAFDQGMSILGTTVGQAATGNVEAAKKFAALGLSIRGADGKIKTSDVLLGEISDKMKGAGSAAEQLAIATDFFGGRGRNFVIALKNGSGELDRMRKEARDLGAVMSEETVGALEELGDNLDSLGYAWRGALASLVQEALPALLAAARGAIAVIKRAGGAARALGQGVRYVVDGFKRAAPYIIAAAVAVGVLTFSFELFSIALWSVNAGFITLGVRAVASAVATGAAWLAAQIPLLAMHALVAGMALIFLGMVVVVGLVAQEIYALFSGMDGLFEKLQGKWGALTSLIFEDIDRREPGIIKVLEYALALVTSLIAGIDQIAGGLFAGAAAVVNAPEEVIAEIKASRAQSRTQGSQSVINEQGQFVSVGGNGYVQPSAAAAARATEKPPVSISVNVDASGQTLDEEKLGGIVRREIDQSMSTANAQALNDLTMAVP